MRTELTLNSYEVISFVKGHISELNGLPKLSQPAKNTHLAALVRVVQSVVRLVGATTLQCLKGRRT